MSGNWVDTMEGRAYNRLQEIFRKRRKARAHASGMRALAVRFAYPETVEKVSMGLRLSAPPRLFKRSWGWRLMFRLADFWAGVWRRFRGGIV